jgi:cardiolipin synthase
VLLAEMTHMKAILIDGEKLVLGSSNFDFVSYHTEEEHLAIVEDSALIRDFEARVLEPALASAVQSGWRPSLARRLAVRWSVRAGAMLVRPLGGARRSAVDW